MEHALVVCRSQTEAIQLRQCLVGAGVCGEIKRLPRHNQNESCSFAVRIKSTDQKRAYEAINRRRLGNYTFRQEENFQ